MPLSSLLHDSGITSVEWSDDRIVMHIDSVNDNGVLRTGRLVFSGVTAVEGEGASLESLQMEREDAEIIDFEEMATGAEIIIQWTRFFDHTSYMKSYRISCSGVTFEFS